MNWDAQSDRAAIRYYSDWCPDGIQEAHRRGARWQREALLSEETVMRVARAIYESAPNKWSWTWAQIVDGWKNKPYTDYPHLVDDMRRQAMAALTAAIGDE